MLKKLIYLPLVSLIFISGCLNYYQETTLKTDGSGEMFVHYWMKVSNAQDSLIVSQFGIFEKDSITKEFLSEYDEIKNIEVYSDGSDSTMHAKIELNFQSIDSFKSCESI